MNPVLFYKSFCISVISLGRRSLVWFDSGSFVFMSNFNRNFKKKLMIWFHSFRCISKTVGPWKSDGKGVLPGQKGKLHGGMQTRELKKILWLCHVEVRSNASPGLLVHLSQALNFMNVSLHQQFYEYLCYLPSENRARLPTNCQPVQENCSKLLFCVELLALLVQ